MDNAETDHAEFLAWFDGMRGQYQNLTREVLFTLRRALEGKAVEVAQITDRVKSVESLKEKLSRKRYDSPREEVTDLAGVRVVCLFQPDVEAVAMVIDRVFDVIHTEDKREVLGSDRMGYQGIHKIVRLDRSFRGARYDDLAQLVCEVQVRTVVQDAWATISHNLVYKSEASTPALIQRSINNVASLLEIAQEVFDSVRERRRQYRAEIEQKSHEPVGFLAQPVNHDTLVEYSLWKFPELLPSERVTQLILRDFNPQRYPSLAEIDAAVNRAKRAVDAYAMENPQVFKYGTDRITKGLGFVDQEFREKHGFAPTTRQAFQRHGHLVSER